MKRLVVTLLSMLALSARAETWDADGSIAAGFVAARLAWDDTVGGSFPRDVHLDGSLVAFGIGLEGFYGPEIADGVALGLGVDATVLPDFDANLGRTGYSFGYEVAGTVETMIHSGTHVWRAGAGAAIAELRSRGGTAVWTPEPEAGYEMVRGPVARGSVAWSLSARVNLAVEVRVGYLFADRLSYVPVMFLATLHAEHIDRTVR